MASPANRVDYHTVMPYLTVRGVSDLIEFLTHAFGGEEVQRVTQPDGSIMHAEVRIGDSIVMMGEPADESRLLPASLFLSVNDTDATYMRAMQAGATSVRSPEDKSYGRSAGVMDPGGNIWWITSPLG